MTWACSNTVLAEHVRIERFFNDNADKLDEVNGGHIARKETQKRRLLSTD